MNNVIEKYYDAFNQQNFEEMLALLTDDVRHDVNEGENELGKDKFRAFLKVMDEHYTEKVVDLVVMSGGGGERMSAEFFIEGTYKKSQKGLPPANNQFYRLPVGAFFEVKGGKIARVTNYYNLAHWIKLVSK
jgi:steroid delta-isomerase-like uncharacterized protein